MDQPAIRPGRVTPAQHGQTGLSELSWQHSNCPQQLQSSQMQQQLLPNQHYGKAVFHMQPPTTAHTD
jgi:hypothetical protein